VVRRHALFGRKRLPLAAGMDTTPLIDIVFQQLIFFMLTSSFVFQTGIRIHLPRSVTSDVAQKENLVVTITRKDRLYVSSRVLTLQELNVKLAEAAKASQPILIRADREATLGRVVAVWDACRALGVSRVHIATHTIEHDNTGQTR